MLPAEHHKAVQRALQLGRNGNPETLPELTKLSKLPSNEIRRLAASAIGKLAEFGADTKIAVAALAPIALHSQHAQTQQYAIRALLKYGSAAQAHAQDLRDIANNPANKNYIRSAAKTAADTIELAAQDANAGGKHRCQRCNAELTAKEHRTSQEAFKRNFCSRCFDETFLARRNFETQVEISKIVEARDGTLVQSQGEKDISEWLTAHNLTYQYDNKYRIIRN